MSAPRVTVVMSVFNGEPHLAEALDSVRRQTLANLELLVIDDGSTDETPSLLARWADPRLRVLRQERMGLTEALRRGVELARTDLVARLDADDVASPDRLARQIALFERDSRLVLVGCWAKIIDDRGNVLESARPPAADDEIRAQLLWDNAFFHSGMTFRRDAALTVGGYDATVARAQDYDLAWRLSKAGRVANVPEFLLRWRRATGSISVAHRREQRRSAGRTAYRALTETLGPMDEAFFWRLREVWDGDRDRMHDGDGRKLADVVARLPAAAGRTVWIELVTAAAAAAPVEAPTLLGAAWRRFPRERHRLVAPDRAARILLGPMGLRMLRAVRHRFRGY